MKFKISLKYLLLSLFLFLVEVLIATIWKHIFFVRAYFGDVIVIFLLYTLVKSFLVVENKKLIEGLFVFSCIIEFAQYLHIATKLGFQPGSLMYIVIGNSFSWIDILCYAAGCVILLIINQLQNKVLSTE